MPKLPFKLHTDNAILILCMSVAFVFWIFNKLSQNFSENAHFDLVYTLPEGYCFSESPTNHFTAKISLQGWALINGKKFNIPVSLNQDSIQEINAIQFQELIAKRLNISIDKVTTPFSKLRYKIEELYQKDLIVNVPYNFTFAEGYGISDKIKVFPPKITVRGPKYYLEQLKYFETDTIILKDLKKDAVVNIQLKDNPLLKFNQKVLKATIKVDQFTEKSIFVPIQFKNENSKLLLFPNKAKVTCGLSLGNYNKLNVNQFTISVDMKNANKTINKSIPIIVEKYPEFVKNISISPKSVQVIVQ